ncbi:MAG: hypothetical protein LBJ48_06295 [Coriobacteriales bacterium]|jgi:antitoxin MazE|nr:hypothetical protein [Coriobacteriales bacterium]
MTTATLTKWGNGQGVLLPKFYCEQIDIKTGDTVQVEVLDDAIQISKIKSLPTSLTELFEGYDGNYQPEEWDIGPMQGREIW